MAEKSTTAPFEEIEAPNPHIKLLQPFAGTFRSTVRMWMGPGEPMQMGGTMVNTFDLGGRFLKQHYTGDGPDGPFGHFEGRGYWGYNTATKQYEGFWIDTAADFFQIEYGQVDASGRRWEMKGEMTSPQDGALHRKRSVIEVADDDHHSMTLYFTGPDKQERKVMEINYVRA